MGMAKALEIIEEEAGHQFCPTCARAFLRMMANGGVAISENGERKTRA